MRILILGGYGVFGGRLAELLSDIPEIELIICGRDFSRAEAFCARYRGQAPVRPLALDRAEIVAGLRAQRPNLVVDASGPFQDYGTNRYRVISACIDAGIDYLDFADAADFVFGVPQFDPQAKHAGIFILSGISSFPVLTAAVLREMAKTMDIVSVKGGIAPSPYAGIGLNVMRAVVGYAGAPVKLHRHGVQSHGIGLAESMRFTIAVPGRLPLRNIRFSLVDVPDLQVIPPEYPSMTDIWMEPGQSRKSCTGHSTSWRRRARGSGSRRWNLSRVSSTRCSTECVLASIAAVCSSARMAPRMGRTPNGAGIFWPKGMTGHTSHRWPSKRSSVNC